MPSISPVAIVMRTKDRPLFLARALDDVLAQSWSEWSLVVVNDGGDPAPVDHLLGRRSTAWDGRVSVIHHPVSLGMEAASNAGLAASESEFVVIHDDDDTWHPTFLERTVAFLRGPGAADGGVVTRTEIVREETVDQSVVEISRQIFWPDLRAITLLDQLEINHFVPISFLYRRQVHETVGAYRKDLPVVGDWAFSLDFLTHFSIGFIDGPPPLAFWHQRAATDPAAGSITALPDQHRLHDTMVREAALRSWAKDNGLGPLLTMTRIQSDRLDRLERLIEDQRRLLELMPGAVADAGLMGSVRRRLATLRRRVKR